VQATNARRRDDAFGRRAMGDAPSPSRIDFAVTEACNLRCAHCITFAPSRTRSGAARTLTPWLLDRLRDELAFAEYVGFVHGGEPLVAPVLHDVLAALRVARDGAPSVVHLLTNGMLLDEPMTARLAAEGVGSISVSLDGASAAVNDRVRAGGGFHRVLENLRAAVRLRERRSLDLRLGISLVVLRDNLDELDAAVDMALDVGVDWLKLEESVPVNRFARRASVSAHDAHARERVGRAVDRGRARGLVVVDHTAPPAVWRCKLAEDDAMRSFLEADEFANRTIIHPCRATWERACIDPDGGVRLGDFFGPRLGSVHEAPLAALWNGPRARAERLAAERQRLCGASSPAARPQGAGCIP
jgi:MoaA/NifB/PqqE/SkfB family radical SAM enzyme